MSVSKGERQENRAMEEFGELIPRGGGDPIPLLKDRLLIGRREGCDVVLRFANVSGQHCRMTLESGYWFVKDLNSRNGTKVNGQRVIRKRLDPGSVVAIAKHEFEIKYSPQALGAFGAPPPDDDHIEELLRRSLLDRAGLDRRSFSQPNKNKDIMDD
jgi:pSer/pThr/pTyr-binding forkhead associated (FHA) protein